MAKGLGYSHWDDFLPRLVKDQWVCSNGIESELMVFYLCNLWDFIFYLGQKQWDLPEICLFSNDDVDNQSIECREFNGILTG